ncbi:recombinase family protein [Streptomyces sp. NPDC041068]|uniref:recombinase family protein n=1 Tax=Streptomyces sp. NPDC041068 TaxID=3155130 RepID=UPI0033C7FD91
MSEGSRPEVDLLLRKSKVVREGERALSIRAQEDRGRAWADQEGYRVRKVWKENLSAYSDVERPKYDAAMKALEDGEVPALWVYALDRFSRKGAGSVLPILDAGRRIVFDYEGLDSSIERDRRWIIQRAEDAREYSERLSYNVRSTKTRQRNEGGWLATPPYGLVIADKGTRQLKHDTASAGPGTSRWGVVERVIDAVADGLSARKTAAKLNADGLRTARGKLWSATQVRRIVWHPVYEGWQVVNPRKTQPEPYLNAKGERVWVLAKGVEAVDADKVARARLNLAGHNIIPGGGDGRPKHLLADLCECSHCGYGMPTTGGSYRCCANDSAAEDDAPKRCDAPASVVCGLLEDYVVSKWRDKLGELGMGDPLMIAMAQRWAALTRPEETEEAREAVAAVKAAKKAQDRLQAAFDAGAYEGGGVAVFARSMRDATARLDAAQQQAEALTGPTVDLTMFVDPGLLEEAWARADLQTRRDLIRVAVARVRVSKAPNGRGSRFHGDDRVSIEWAEPAELEEAAA